MKCPQCKGSGLCRVCAGIGDVLDEHDRYVRCAVCRGHALCPRCAGYGDLPDEQPVTVVSLRGDTAQIARRGIGLRWVRLETLEVYPCR